METLGQPLWIGQYRLTSRVATGGMAEVYVGRHVSPEGVFGPMVAVKRLLPHLVKDSSIVRMFLNEARITSQIHHPNVVGIHELGQVEGEPFIAMELLEGHTFADVRTRAAEEGKRVPLGVALRILADACRGLDAAHRATGEDGQPLALVHRDFTPDNIHVGVKGEVKVIDFGIAKTASWGAGTEPGTLKGKFFYMSPEMILAKPVDHRADLFAAGVMLYEQLCGRRPFTGKSVDEVVMKIARGDMQPPSAFDPSIPGPLEEIVLKALKRDPLQRFPSLQEFVDAIESVGGVAEVATTEEVGEYMGSVFPLTSDHTRQSIRRAREADPSVPGHKATGITDPQEVKATVPVPVPAYVPHGAKAPVIDDSPEPPTIMSPQGDPRVEAPPKEKRERKPLPVKLIAGVVVGLAAVGALVFAVTHTRPAADILADFEAATAVEQRADLAEALAGAKDVTEEQLAQVAPKLTADKSWNAVNEVGLKWAALDKESVDAWLLQAKAAVMTRKAKTAEAAIEMAEEAAPKDARPVALLAELRELQGDARGALAMWQKASLKDPKTIRYKARAGYWMSQSGQVEEAEALLKDALKAKFNPIAAAELAFVYFRKSKPDEAKRLLERVVKEDPSLLEGHYYLGAVLYQKGDIAGARAQYLEADKLADEDARPLTALCEMEQQQSSPELETAKKLIQTRFPRDAEAMLRRCAASAPPPDPER